MRSIAHPAPNALVLTCIASTRLANNHFRAIFSSEIGNVSFPSIRLRAFSGPGCEDVARGASCYYPALHQPKRKRQIKNLTKTGMRGRRASRALVSRPTGPPTFGQSRSLQTRTGAGRIWAGGGGTACTTFIRASLLLECLFKSKWRVYTLCTDPRTSNLEPGINVQ